MGMGGRCDLPAPAQGDRDPAGGPSVVDPDTGTITCATPGAAIFYRVDGRRPNPRAGTSTWILSLESGSQLIARAYLAGFLDSDYATLNAPKTPQKFSCLLSLPSSKALQSSFSTASRTTSKAGSNAP